MRAIASLILTALLAAPALAQVESSMADRLNRLERDVTFLQRQVYRGSDDAGAAPAPAGSTAAMQVQLTQIAEEMRQLRGRIEQAEFSNQRLEAEFRKLSEDIDYRLQALEQRQAAASVPTESAAASAEEAEAEEMAVYTPEDTMKGEDAGTHATGGDFPNSNAHYNHAFKLLNDKNYSAAATSFDAFVKKYPRDPLVTNAYYWLGESYYARGDYTRAAEGFRKGFEANPEGQKAADNLFKLALSLKEVKRKNEACVILSQVANKYGDKAPRTAERAKAERLTLECK